MPPAVALPPEVPVLNNVPESHVVNNVNVNSLEASHMVNNTAPIGRPHLPALPLGWGGQQGP
jgi:hypothetical protein